MKELLKDILLVLGITTVFLISISLLNERITRDNYDMGFRMGVSDTSTIQNTASIVNYSTSTLSYFSPRSERNPFISPVEYEKIRIAEQKKLAEELTRKLQEKIKVKKENPIRKYKLQGIVGKYAIINNEMIEEGQSYKKELKVKKVYSSYVIVEYKGKEYKLILK